MSSLRSAVDELASDQLDYLDDRGLLDDVAELSRDLAALEAQRLRRIAEIDRRLAIRHDGALSTTAWLRNRCGFSAGSACEQLRIARGLRHAHLTQARFEAGDIDLGRVRVLMSAQRRHPDVFSRDEQTLVEAATSLSQKDLRRLLDYWAQALDHREALADDEARHRRRRLHVSRTFGGIVRCDGDLDPEGGEIVLIALQALAERNHLDETDDRTPAQARADALVDICRDQLDRGAVPTVGRNRPHLLVVADLETLEGRAGCRAETEDGAVLHPEAIRRIACDAGVCRIITDAAGRPLDVGRTTRAISPALWRALLVRDGGCTAPGCDRPPRWCDAHHIRHWIDGGHTKLDNLRLLCRRHHRMHHEGAALARAP